MILATPPSANFPAICPVFLFQLVNRAHRDFGRALLISILPRKGNAFRGSVQRENHPYATVATDGDRAATAPAVDIPFSLEVSAAAGSPSLLARSRSAYLRHDQ